MADVTAVSYSAVEILACIFPHCVILQFSHYFKPINSLHSLCQASAGNGLFWFPVTPLVSDVKNLNGKRKEKKILYCLFSRKFVLQLHASAIIDMKENIWHKNISHKTSEIKAFVVIMLSWCLSSVLTIFWAQNWKFEKQVIIHFCVCLFVLVLFWKNE